MRADKGAKADPDPDDAGLVKVFDPIKGVYRTMNDLAAEQSWRDELHERQVRCAKTDSRGARDGAVDIEAAK